MSVQDTSGDPLAHFTRCIPRQPFASDNLTHGVWRTRKWAALSLPFIQPCSVMIWCLVFDVDHEAAYWAAEDGILPQPNLIVLNRHNGKGHVTFFLQAPVPKTDAAKLRPLQYLAMIERGMVRRLDADPNYSGFVTKNPRHPDWRTFRKHGKRYELGELHECLHDTNCTFPPRKETYGLSRNCTVFDLSLIHI